MKRLISILLLIALLACCCGCGSEPAPEADVSADASESIQETQATTEDETQPEETFDHINELEPVDGVYLIHSIVGVENIAKHLDGKFELLCNVDLGGAELAPIGSKSAPFTGKINGKDFTISNFTISQETADGDMGFFGANDGNVLNLNLKEVTVIANKNTKNLGALAGVNTGILRRCGVEGTMTVDAIAVDAACGSAVGVNTHILESAVVDVDLNYTAKAGGFVGGLVGSQEGGKLIFCDTKGAFTVEGATNTAIGLFAGSAKQVDLESNTFYGEINQVRGKTFDQLLGVQEEATNTGWAIRDNSAPELPADVMEKRKNVAEAMREMGLIEWTVSEPLTLEFECPCCNTRTFLPGQLYRGVPYNHKSGSMQRFEYCLDENNVIEDWVYDMAAFDGWDMYIGNDCSSAVIEALSTEILMGEKVIRARTQFPAWRRGTVPVGDWVWDLPLGETAVSTEPHILKTGREEMCEAYAQLRIGDCIGNILPAGGHVRMVTGETVVMRDETGAIDPNLSYIVTTEQLAGQIDEGEYRTSWVVDRICSFESLLNNFYVPYTFPALLESDSEETSVVLEGGMEGRAGLTTGVIRGNENIDSVEMVITNAQGEEVFSKRMFVSVGRKGDSESEVVDMRKSSTEYDLMYFAAPLREVVFDTSESYHCVITAHLKTNESIVVKDYDF